ncbi:MAG: hypothetical protein ACR2HM_02825 [Acidimicrobiales bacterium]
MPDAAKPLSAPVLGSITIRLDTSPEADRELQTAQLAHALVGAVEADATRADQDYRDAGAEPPTSCMPP